MENTEFIESILMKMQQKHPYTMALELYAQTGIDLSGPQVATLLKRNKTLKPVDNDIPRPYVGAFIMRQVILMNEKRYYYNGSTFVKDKQSAKAYAENEALILLDAMRENDRRVTESICIVYVS